MDVEENGCITDDGQMLQEGEVIKPGPCRICKCEDKSIMCEEKMCEPLVCHDDQVYAITDEECCPMCMGEILILFVLSCSRLIQTTALDVYNYITCLLVVLLSFPRQN